MLLVLKEWISWNRMAASGNTQQTFRRAIGALKDSTKVGLAKVNSENKVK